MEEEKALPEQGKDGSHLFPDKLRHLITKKRLAVACGILAMTFLVFLGIHIWSFNHPTVYSGEYEVSAVSNAEQKRLADTFEQGIPSGLKARTDLQKPPDYTGTLSVTKTIYDVKDYQIPLDSVPTYAGMTYRLDYGSVSLSSDATLVSMLDGSQFKGECAELTGSAAQSCARQDALSLNTGAVEVFLHDIGGYGKRPIVTSYQADQIIEQMNFAFQAQALQNEKYDDDETHDIYFDVGDYIVDISYVGSQYKYYVDDFTMVNKKARQVVDDYAQRGERSWKNPRFQAVFVDKNVIDIPREASSSNDEDTESIPSPTLSEKGSESPGANSEDNPKTALSKAYWACTPQSQQKNFEWNLSPSEDWAELMGTKDWSATSLNREVFGCFLEKLDLPSTDIIKTVSNGNSSQGYQTKKYGGYSITWSTGEDGNVDITVSKGNVKTSSPTETSTPEAQDESDGATEAQQLYDQCKAQFTQGSFNTFGLIDKNNLIYTDSISNISDTSGTPLCLEAETGVTELSYEKQVL